MPLTAKGTKILGKLRSQYGAKKGETIFYKMIAEKKITGAEGAKLKKKRKKK